MIAYDANSTYSLPLKYQRSPVTLFMAGFFVKWIIVRYRSTQTTRIFCAAISIICLFSCCQGMYARCRKSGGGGMGNMLKNAES